MLLMDGGRVSHHIVEGWWKDTGTPEYILESNRLILDEQGSKIDGAVEDGASVQGRVVIGKGSRIMKEAKVRGPSIIGEDTVLESGVEVGPYASIGNHVTIKRGER